MMKAATIRFSTIVLLFFCQNVRAQIKYTVKDALNHVNETITVCDTVFKVASVNLKTHRFYLGAASPEKFIVVIDNVLKRKHIDYSFMIGHEACVTGKIKHVNGSYILYLTGKFVYMGPIDL